MSQSPLPPDSTSNYLSRLLRIAKKPCNVAIGLASVTIIIIGYTGLRLFLQKYLPPWLEKQVSYLINRPVDIDELQGFSLTRLDLGSTSVPPTSDHPNQLTASRVVVHFDPIAVLFRRTLVIKIVPEDVEVELHQYSEGELLKGKITDEIIPLKLDITFDVTNVAINVFPQSTNNLLVTTINGQARYSEVAKAKWDYDLKLVLLSSEISLEGETFTDTKESQVKLAISKLDISQLIPLIVNFPVQLHKGDIEANINLDLPSIEKLSETKAKGEVKLDNFKGKIKFFENPLQAVANISFQENKVLIKKAQVKLSNITTNLSGQYNWNTGFDLEANISGLSSKNIQEVSQIKLPVEVEGELQAKLNLIGTINAPLLRGKIENKKIVEIAKTKLEKITINFQSNFDDFLLKDLLVVPEVGGWMAAEGMAKPKIIQALIKGKPINWNNIPFKLVFKTDLPSQKIVNNYHKLPIEVNLNNLTAQGIINGSLADIKGLIKWNTAANLNRENTKISSNGNILINKDDVIFNNIELVTRKGRLIINGVGNFKSKKWQAYVNSNFLDLTPFISEICNTRYTKCPTNISLKSAEIKIEGNFNKTWKKSINLSSNLALVLDDGNLVINSQLQKAKFTISVAGFKLSLSLLLSNIFIPITLRKYQFNLSGNIEEILQKSTIDVNAIKGDSNLELEIDKSPINTQITWQNGFFEGNAMLKSLSLNQFVPQLAIPVQLTNSKINFLGSLQSLLSLSHTPNFNDFQVNADTQFKIADGIVTAISKLNQGKITVNAIGTPVLVSKLLPQLSIPIEVKKTDINLIAYLPDLLAFDLNTVQGNAQIELEVGKKAISTSIQLINNQWHTNIIANQLDLSTWKNKLFFSQILEPIDAKINLSGTLESLLSPDFQIPIQANSILVEIGQQNLKANGNIILANIFNDPDITSVNLNIETQAYLKNLPITQFLSKIPIYKNLLPQAIDLAGKGKFKGSLVAKKLLTSSLEDGNFQLKGNLILSNFAVNELDFESILKGEIDLVTGKNISLDLRGKKDVITAIFTSCSQQQCFLPYIPYSFEISQKYSNFSPILIKGNRQVNHLVANIQNFPLKQLKLSPISNYGSTDYLGGKVNLNLEVDLLTLISRGKLDIINPNLGEVSGNNLQINWVYQNDYVTLTNTTLELGKSSYNIRGEIALKTGEIKGNLKVDKGYIQELLTVLKISDFDSFLRFLQFKKDSLTHFKQVIPQPIGSINAPLAEQVNQLWENDQKIRENTVERQASKLPRELDIKGEFHGEISLSGTLKTPEITFQFEGESWEWISQPPTPSIINSLGFVLEDSPVISFEKLAIKGKLDNGIININPIIKLNGSLIQANLNLTYDNNQFHLQPSNFSLNNLTLDTVRSLIAIPGDINGSIDLAGNLTGSLIKPEIDGIFSLEKVVINARLLRQSFQGNFNYGNAQLELQIDKPNFIQAYARLPLPIEINNDNRFKINVRLGTEAFSLLEIVTQEQVSLVKGEGKIDFYLSGQIIIDDEVKISFDPDSRSILDLNSITFKSYLSPNTLTLNGEIAIQNRKIEVNKLTGKIGEITVNTMGVLPFFSSSLENIDSAIPLSITLTPSQISPDNLYQGIANALIFIKGTVFNPIIEGEIQLNQGKFIVPSFISDVSRKTESSILEEWIRRISFLEEVVILPKFNDFRVSIKEVEIEQKDINPKFIFNVSGNLDLSGQLASFSLPGLLALKPSGTVYINSGKVDIPVTRVFIPRQPNNTITFLPQKGLLNPYIDLEFKLYILNIALRAINANEVADDIVQSGRSQSVEITLGIKGDANQLLPNLGTKLEEVCKLRLDNYRPIPQTAAIDPNKLRQLIDCIKVNNLGTNSIQDLLQSPIVSFSSSPRLSSSELLTLFGTQLPNLVEQLQQQNSAQLVEAGLPQVAVVLFPFLQDWLFELNETTNQVGKEWGIGNLRLYPVLETVYELEDDSLIRFSYDYSFNEVIIRYENKF
ncbi:MAG: translocation/assembly module TamB domain-containing protein [cyanobacterium endosymbiont of Rhopalodia sterrenbergii]